MDKRVQEYLKSDRQWPRECRLGHAKLKLTQCHEDDKKFWQAVINANTL